MERMWETTTGPMCTALWARVPYLLGRLFARKALELRRLGNNDLQFLRLPVTSQYNRSQ